MSVAQSPVREFENAKFGWPLRRVETVSEIFDWVEMLDHRALASANRLNVPSIMVHNRFLAEVLPRDPNARLFGLDFTMFNTAGFVTDAIKGYVEQVNERDFTVQLPHRRHFIGSTHMRDVSVELAQHVVEYQDPAAVYQFAAAQGVRNAVLGIKE